MGLGIIVTVRNIWTVFKFVQQVKFRWQRCNKGIQIICWNPHRKACAAPGWTGVAFFIKADPIAGGALYITPRLFSQSGNFLQCRFIFHGFQMQLCIADNFPGLSGWICGNNFQFVGFSYNGFVHVIENTVFLSSFLRSCQRCMGGCWWGCTIVSKIVGCPRKRWHGSTASKTDSSNYSCQNVSCHPAVISLHKVCPPLFIMSFLALYLISGILEAFCFIGKFFIFLNASFTIP